MDRLTIITGHYGSGKTTFSLNLAIERAKESGGATLVDLDIVNPYFRSSDHKEMLESCGIRVVSPAYANTNLDLPGLPAEMYGAFEAKGEIIVDVGGDDSGATALGRFSHLIKSRQYELLCVINARRNLTATTEEAADLLREIEAACKLTATGLVNNTHLKQLTTAQTILDSADFANEASRLTGLPLVYTTAPKGLAHELGQVENLYPVEPFVKTPWEM